MSRRGFGGLTALALLAASSTLGCNTSADKGAAEREVVDFHRQLDAGSYAALYAAGHPDFKKVASEADFVALLEAVHRKLGTVVSTAPVSYKFFSGTAGTSVMLGYQTKFRAGEGLETFSYRIEGGRALLLGYNINSMALITK